MKLIKRSAVSAAYVIILLSLMACSSMKDKRHLPTCLTEYKSVLDVQQKWKVSVGKGGSYLFSPIAVDDVVYAAGLRGTVAKFDARSGKEIWRAKLDRNLTAGVGSDGNFTAVGALNGQIYVLGPTGQLLWKAIVLNEIISPPLVGNGFVIIRTIDGKINAFKAQTGEQKWIHYNHAVPLNLRVSVGMTFSGSTAVLVGFPDGNFAAINLQTGDTYWKTLISDAKGVTEVERINDVIGAPTLVGTVTCAATFQGQLGCFDVNLGRVIWKKPFSSTRGIVQDDYVVIGVNNRSGIEAFDVTNGALLWRSNCLEGRNVSTPFLLGKTVVLGDHEGFVNFLSRDSGTLIARIQTNGNAITEAPILAGDTLVVQTHNGNLYGFRLR